MMTTNGKTDVEGKMKVANMINTYFTRTSEKASEEVSQNLTPNSADFQSTLRSSTQRSIGNPGQLNANWMVSIDYAMVREWTPLSAEQNNAEWKR